MSPSSLDSLPPEIIVCISEYLDSRTKSHIVPFARANKICYSASLPCLYRTIRLHTLVLDPRYNIEPHMLMRDQQQLGKDVASWQSRLERDAAYQHVLCIKIWEPDSLAESGGSSCLEEPDSDDDFADLPLRCQHTPLHLEDAEFPAEEDALSPWSDLSRLIEKLPALRNLQFDCSRPLPFCLLRALCEANPYCKLHLDTFHFEGYLHPGNRNPKELSLLLSPRLAGVRTRSSGYTIEGKEDYSHEAVFALMSGLQPALEHVSLLTNLGFYASHSMGHGFFSGILREPFPGFKASKKLFAGQNAILKSFEMGGSKFPNTELLTQCLRHCDVSKLRILKLCIRTTHCSLDWLALHAKFEMLTTLVLGEESNRFEGVKIGDQDFSAAFIRSLPPLKAIRFMCDTTEEVFQATMKRHGHSLRRLWYPPPVRGEEAMRLNTSYLFSDTSRVAGLRRLLHARRARINYTAIHG